MFWSASVATKQEHHFATRSDVEPQTSPAETWLSVPEPPFSDTTPYRKSIRQVESPLILESGGLLLRTSLQRSKRILGLCHDVFSISKNRSNQCIGDVFIIRKRAGWQRQSGYLDNIIWDCVDKAFARFLSHNAISLNVLHSLPTILVFVS